MHIQTKKKIGLLQKSRIWFEKKPIIGSELQFFDQIKLVKGSEKWTTLTFIALKDTEGNKPKSVERRANSFHAKATNKETTIKFPNE